MAIAERKQHDAGGTSRRDAIDELYTELRELAAESTGDLSANPGAQRRLTRLRVLQDEEAEAMRRRLDKSLHLKPGTGYRALEEARRLLAEHAHPAPKNLPTSR